MRYNEINKNTNLLHEASYKEILSLIDDQFLGQKARLAMIDSVKFDSFQDNTMVFNVPGSGDSGKIYRNLVNFQEWPNVVHDNSLNPMEAARLLLWVGNLKLHCDCPSFKFFGYQYILTVLDSAIYPEERKPIKNNPKERGVCCKHMRKVLQVLPFHATTIAQHIGMIRNQS